MLSFLRSKDNEGESPKGIQFEHPQSFEELAGFLRYNGTTYIYKHSTRCSVSLFSMRRLNQVNCVENEQWLYIDVVADRSMSMALAEELSIRHESPQLIMLKDGKVIAHTSHQEVHEDTVEAWRKTTS
jgi:bacillithiol system protein YtxJ